MAARKRSKTVDDAIRKCWARLAEMAFKKAKNSAEFGHMVDAASHMTWVESWLDKAGAQATRWDFHAY